MFDFISRIFRPEPPSLAQAIRNAVEQPHEFAMQRADDSGEVDPNSFVGDARCGGPAKAHLWKEVLRD